MSVDLLTGSWIDEFLSQAMTGLGVPYKPSNIDQYLHGSKVMKNGIATQQ